MGKGIDHGHIIFARPKLVPGNNGTVNRTTKEVPTIRVASMECDIRRSNLQSHDLISSWLLGSFHYNLCQEWNCTRNCKKNQRLLDKGYQRELPTDVWMMVFFPQSEGATHTWNLFQWPCGINGFPPDQPWLLFQCNLQHTAAYRAETNLNIAQCPTTHWRGIQEELQPGCALRPWLSRRS